MMDAIPRTRPEWPTEGEQAIVWKFDEPGTLYFYSIGNGVQHLLARRFALGFDRHAQHPKCILFYYVEPRKRSQWRRPFPWFEPAHTFGQHEFPADPGEGWLVIARGYHPLPLKPIVEHGHGVRVFTGYEPITIEAFEAWLAAHESFPWSEDLEVLVDFREAAIAAGWRPSYPGCRGNPPAPPPDALRRWYPELNTEEVKR